MSPTDDLFSTGYPGGIYNDGFAASWIAQRIDDAMPAATLSNGQLVPLSTTPVSGVGQPWVYYEIDADRSARAARRPVSPTRRSTASPRACIAGRAPAGRPGTGPGRDPSLFDRRSMSRVGEPDQRAGLRVGRPPGRADRSAVARAARRLARDRPRCSPMWSMAATSTRPTPRPSAAGSSSSTSTSPTRSRRADRLAAPRPRRLHQLRRPVPRPRLRCRPSGSPNAATLADARLEFTRQTPRVRGALRQRCRPGRCRATRSRPTRPPSPAGRRPGGPTLYFGPNGRCGRGTPAATGQRPFTLDPSAGRRPACRRAATPGRPTPAGTGRPVPPSDGLAFQTAPSPRTPRSSGRPPLDLWVGVGHPGGGPPGHHHRGPPAIGQEEYVTSGFLRSSNQVDLSDVDRAVHRPDYLGRDAARCPRRPYRLVKIPIDPIGTPSGPAPSCGSSCRHPAATGRCGSSTPSTTASRCRSASAASPRPS